MNANIQRLENSMPNAPKPPGPLKDSASQAHGRPAEAVADGDFAARWHRQIGLETRSPSVDPHFATSGASAAAPAPVAWAESGAMLLTGPADGPPRWSRGAVATTAAELGRLLASLAPEAHRLPRDPGKLLGERAAIAGLERRGLTSAGGHAHLMLLKNDWIGLNLARDDDWRALPAWLEVSPESLPGGDVDALREALAGRDARPLVERGRLMGLAVAIAERDVPNTRVPTLRTYENESASRPPALRPEADSPRPRVLDLSTLWAGPLAGSLLARSGFDVLKIESPGRPDGARQGPEAFFDLMNGEKQGCALDLKAPADRAIFERLLASADVVLESARPRSLEQLGYDAPSWLTEKTGRLWISITGHGREGPARDWIAYGDDAALAAGLGFSPGEPEPCFCGDALADPLGGLHAAATTLAHWRAGVGGLLDISLVASAADAAAGPFDESHRRALRLQDGQWFFETAAGLHAIAPPQARPVTGKAPALATPDDTLLERWTRAC